MKHTPGPWKAIKSASGHDITAPVMQYSDTQFVNDAHLYRLPTKEDIQWKMGKDGLLYASLSYETWRQFPMEPWDSQQEANANLMAAAPTLLLELSRLSAEVGPLLTHYSDGLRELIGNTNFAVLKQKLKEAEEAIAKAEGQ